MTTPEQTTAPNKRGAKTGHHRIELNVFFNVLSYATNFVISFLLAPLMVRELGDVGYGIWVFSLQIGAYLSVLDLGIRIAVTRYLTHHHTRQEHSEVSVVISVALTVLSGLCVFCVLASGVVAAVLPRWMHLPAAAIHDARWAVFLVGTSVALTFPGALFSGALAALSRYDLLNSRNIFTVVLQAVLFWFFLVRGHGVLTLAIIFLFIKVLMYTIDFTFAWNVYGGFKFALYRDRFRPTLTTLSKFSIFAFLLGISTRLLIWSDNVVIGLVLGPAAVTFYAIGGNLVDNLRSLMTTITTVFVPLATSFNALSDRDGLARLLKQGSKFTFLLVYPIAAGYFIFGKPFIHLWMGPKYEVVSSTVLILLSVPVLFAPIQATCNQILYGMNRHRPYSALAICEALVNLGLSIVLAKKIGIIGVAWGTLVPAVIVEGILLPMYAVRQLDIPITSYYWSTLIRPILSSAPYLLALAAFRKAGTVWTWHGILASGVASVCVYAICVWLFVLDADEKLLLINRLKRLKPAKATPTLGVEQSR